MLTEGTGIRIDAAALNKFASSECDLFRCLQGYTQIYVEQVSANLLASARYLTCERVARWLLLVSERLPTPHLSVSHEDVAYALGIRRAGVTEAIANLSASHCIVNSRRNIEIVDRAALVRASGGCYP